MNRIEAEILAHVRARGAGKSICPSEVARALEPDEEAWRRLLGPVRAAAIRLARQGQVAILRKGKPVSVTEEVRGVIRLALPLPAAEE